jgi:hypothetical protein
MAKALNMQIRRLAEMLPGGLEHLYGFSCECGCAETFQLSATEFDHQRGAWLEGHRDGGTESPLRHPDP